MPAQPCARCSGARTIARVLLTRPQPLADETAARLSAAGHDVILSPLLEPVAVAWEAPAGPFDALLLTSPQAPRLAGPAVAAYHRLPVYAVGERTAQAARAAGFTDVRDGGGDLVALYAAVAAAGIAHALHLAGEHRTEAPLPPGLTVEVRTVYEAHLADLTPAAAQALRAGVVDWALLFSSRTAAHFAACCDALGIPRTNVAVAAISPKALAAAGAGWRRAVTAGAPTAAGILAAAGLACDNAQA